MQRRFRRVFCALKEHSCVKYAKIATFGGFCDLDFIVVKATSPDDFPLPEKYIHQLLNIFSISPSSFHYFSLCFTRRFGRTHCWRVALKCLVLLHRLLRSLPEQSPFRTELLWARSNGLINLYPCRFRDDSSSNPEDYTSFIRSYAQLLDEALACFYLDKKVKDEEAKTQEEEEDKMKEVDRILEILPQLQTLLNGVMDCRPTGSAARSFIVQSAMKQIVRDSFFCFSKFRKEISMVLDNLVRLPYRSCILCYGVYKKVALQVDQLSEFYDWCKEKGLCGSYEYPSIEKIPEMEILSVGSVISGMLQLTESSSSSTTSPSSWVGSYNQSLSSAEEGEKEKQEHARMDIVAISTDKWVTFEDSFNSSASRKVETMAPLIQLEDEEKNNWEGLLDASVDIYRMPCNGYFRYSGGYGDGCREEEDYNGKDGNGEKTNQWQMIEYIPNATNPFC